MDQGNHEPLGVDPDNIPETLCIGKFNITIGANGLATMTFTHLRAKAGPLLDNSQLAQESVVRARIVTTKENVIALRDLLSTLIKNEGVSAAFAVTGGSGKLN
jgi:hypothetical protein